MYKTVYNLYTFDCLGNCLKYFNIELSLILLNLYYFIYLHYITQFYIQIH